MNDDSLLPEQPPISNPAEIAKAFASLGASKGGKARAKSLSPEQRSEIARRAVEARWGKVGKAPTLRATHGSKDHPLRIGDAIEIPCYVLEGGRRVLHQRAMVRALGMARGGSSRGGGDRLAYFVAQDRLKQFVSDHLREVTQTPIKFVTPDGLLAYGYEATVLADICEAVLAARTAGVLQKQQEHIAAQCEVLVRGFARVGIIALVDEATGYQAERERDALAKILEAFIAKELRPWMRTFEPEFYQELFRLRGIEFKGTLKAPRFIGKLTNDLVYDRLAPGVRDELNRINPNNEKGQRKHKNFQWLTQHVGYQKLKQHLAALTVLMKVFDDWDTFKKKLDLALPRQPSNPLFDKPKDGDEVATD